jgi:hypothetical protein
MPLLSAMGFMYIQKKQIIREVKWKIIDGLQKEELVLIKLTIEESKKELYWEHSKEFEYKGEMYDLVEKKSFEDSVYYWCWWDHRETALNKRLTQLVDSLLGNNHQRQKNKERAIDFYSFLFFEELGHHLGNQIKKKEKAKLRYILNYRGLTISPKAPPPKC